MSIYEWLNRDNAKSDYDNLKNELLLYYNNANSYYFLETMYYWLKNRWNYRNLEITQVASRMLEQYPFYPYFYGIYSW